MLSGLSIYDTMQHIRSEIVTVNMGLAASMASFLLSAGCRGHRYALPHSRTMIHQPSGRAQGQAEDIRIEVNQVLRMKANIIKQYSMLTGKSVDQITKDIDRYLLVLLLLFLCCISPAIIGFLVCSFYYFFRIFYVFY